MSSFFCLSSVSRRRVLIMSEIQLHGSDLRKKGTDLDYISKPTNAQRSPPEAEKQIDEKVNSYQIVRDVRERVYLPILGLLSLDGRRLGFSHSMRVPSGGIGLKKKGYVY